MTSARLLAVILFISLAFSVPIEIQDEGIVGGNSVKLFLFDDEGRVLRIVDVNTTNGSWNTSFVVDVPLPSLLFKDYWVDGVDRDFVWGERKPIFITQNPILLYIYDVLEGLLAFKVRVEGLLPSLEEEVRTLAEKQGRVESRLGVLEEKQEELEGRVPSRLIDLEDTPDKYREGRLLYVKDGRFVYVSPNQIFEDDVGARTFLELLDTPNSYAGHAGDVIAVNPTEDGLTFTTITVSDERVKATPTDPTAGYLEDKVDDVTIEVASNRLQVKDGGITTSKLANGAITTNKIADDAVVSNKIADNSIYSSHIVDGQVFSADIADGQVFSVDIADNGIYSVDIADGQVFSNDIADNTIVDADISPSANIQWGKISKAGSSIADLGDVDSAMSPTAGQALVWSGTQWTAQTLPDEKVKASSSDPTAGYLVDKIDGATIKLNTGTQKIYVDDEALEGNIEHNDLAGLQGGTTGEYYHLSQSQYNALTSNQPFADGYLVFSNGGALDASIVYYDTANGRIGIGTTSPTSKLQVNGVVRSSGFSSAFGTASRPAYRFTDDADTGIFSPVLNHLAFSTGGVERVRITDSGSVGIGTPYPGAKLHVEGGEIWEFSDGANPRFVIGDTPTSGDYGWLQWDSANNYFRIDTSDTPSLGLKVKGNTMAVGNVYPDAQAVAIFANGSEELARLTKGGELLLRASPENITLSTFSPSPYAPLKMKEEVDESIALFGVAYSYKVPIALSTPSNVTKYSLKLIVPYQSGMRSDYGDLAFAWVNPSTGNREPLNHWVESYNSNNATVWVYIPLVYDGQTIYMYYGNPSVNNPGDPEKVFLYYDNFTSNKGWTPVGSAGSWSITGGSLRMWGNWGGCCDGSCIYNSIKAPATFDLPIIVELEFEQNAYSATSSCARTGPAVIYQAGSTAGQAVVSTSTGGRGWSLHMNGGYTNGGAGFPAGRHNMTVYFLRDAVRLIPDWTSPASYSSGTFADGGYIALAGDSDSSSSIDYVYWMRVRRLGFVNYTLGSVGSPSIINVTSLFVNNSRVGVGTETPEATLHVKGDVIVERLPSTTGVDVGVDSQGRLVKISSSQRYKDNIHPLDVDSEAIYALEPKAFTWKETGAKGYGLIAEEVEKVLPEMVIRDERGRPDAVDYRMLQMLMLEELKKLRQDVDELKEVNRELLEENQALREENEELRQQLEEGTCGTGQ